MTRSQRQLLVMRWSQSAKPTQRRRRTPGLTVPDGRVTDHTVILWDVDSGQRIGQPLKNESGSMFSITFSPNGETIAVANFENIILWDVSLESWQIRICDLANRNLTIGEFQQFIGDEPYHKTCPNLPAGE